VKDSLCSTLYILRDLSVGVVVDRDRARATGTVDHHASPVLCALTYVVYIVYVFNVSS
jgi:hypothetical protein